MNSKLFCFNAKKVKNILFFIQSGIVGLGIITFAIQLEITESEMETTEGGHNGNCGCVPKPDHMKQDSGL